MLNHVMVGSNNIAKSKEFYDAVLGVLGARPAMEHTNSTGQKRLFYFHNGSTFAISEPINGQPPSSANGSTIGFACDSPESVQEFHDVAISNGGKSIEGAPGLREGNDLGDRYLCYFLDPDSHKICGIHRPSN